MRQCALWSVDFSPLCPGLAACIHVFPRAEAGVTSAKHIPWYSDSSAPSSCSAEKKKFPAMLRASQGHNHSRCWLPLPESEASRLRKCETEFPLNQPDFSASPAIAPQHHSPALLPSAGPSLPDLISPTEIVWVLIAQDSWKCLQNDLNCLEVADGSSQSQCVSLPWRQVLGGNSHNGGTRNHQ